MRSPILLAIPWTLLAALTVPANAAELVVEKVSLRQERRRLVITARGTAAGCSEGLALIGRISWRGEEGAAVTARVQKERFEATWSLNALLLPGDYTLVLGPDPAASPAASGPPRAARAPFTYGDPKQAKAALKRSRAWLLRAESSLRRTALELENRAAWRRTRVAALGPGAAARDQRRGFRQYLEQRLFPALRVAAMDLKVYNRRLLFPPDPEAADLIGRLPGLMRERSRAHLAAIDKGAAPAADEALAPYRALARRIARLLGQKEDRLVSPWVLGPQASPERGALADGVYLSENGGFQLRVPEGWRHRPSTRQPDLRLALSPVLAEDAGADERRRAAGLAVVVTLREQAEELGPGQSAGIAGWEGWTAYRRRALDVAADGRSLRHLFDAELGGRDLRILERRVRRPDGRWVVLLARAPREDFARLAELYESIAASLEARP